MNYDEYLMHLNRQFDESKVNRDKSGRFAKKASVNRILSGPDVIDMSEVIKEPTQKTRDELTRVNVENAIKKTQSNTNRFASMPDDQTQKQIENKMKKSIADREYKLAAKKYRQKMKRILSRLIKREISLRSAVTVMNHATKERVDEFMKRNFRTGTRNHYL
ncbi:MAG: hypothetical protein J6U54_17620 [Clostridiales bacterium]|nr:hypothetical protein [Clostridiales bacterium]